MPLIIVLASSTLLLMPHAASALCRMLQTLEWDDPVLSEFPLAVVPSCLVLQTCKAVCKRLNDACS